VSSSIKPFSFLSFNNQEFQREKRKKKRVCAFEFDLEQLGQWGS